MCIYIYTIYIYIYTIYILDKNCNLLQFYLNQSTRLQNINVCAFPTYVGQTEKSPYAAFSFDTTFTFAYPSATTKLTSK